MRTKLILLVVGLFAAWNSFATPQIERWETSNGAKVLYVHTPDIPMIDVRVIFDAGSARDGEQGGVAGMTNGLLSTGAAQRGEEAWSSVDRTSGTEAAARYHW